ncbi:MAG TPA: M23 family metallopeptidase [Chitinophagaceae bacterium]
MRNLLVIIFFLPAFLQTTAQRASPYFRNPLGIPMQLVANFGEVRPDHFHMGFDLRTNQRENLPVYAAAEGYVSRVIVEPGGYGRCIFITHPKGYTTLYAHLNAFYPELQRYLEEKQYAEERWEQDIVFPKGKFPVSKGQYIAKSGNTGASQGPHLHFEIRDTRTGNNLNPRMFDFPIVDNIRPFIYRFYMYDRNYSTYQAEPSEIRIRGGNGNYSSRESVVKTGSGKISFGISTEDKGNSTGFRFGVYAAAVWMDSVPVISFTLDQMNYEDSRYANASIDYRKKMRDGVLIQHLSKLPGNQLSIFDGAGDGVITLKDTLPHRFTIAVRDISGNESVLNFVLQWRPELYEPLMFTQDREQLLPNRASVFSRDNIIVRFPATAFYDTVPFLHGEASTGHNSFPLHQLHYADVPVHDPYTVSVKPEGEFDGNKMIWRLVSGRSTYTSPAELKNGWFSGSFDRFGILHLEKDEVAPVVSTIGWKTGSVFGRSGAITVSVKDDRGNVPDFRAELDGNWLMFSRKGNVFSYRFDERCSNGDHELKITTRDVAGNETVRTFQFRLLEKLPAKKKKTRSSGKRKR